MISPADVVTIASSALLIRSPGILFARRMRLVTPLEAVRRRVGASAPLPGLPWWLRVITLPAKDSAADMGAL
jgi:hypothetical protein